MKKSTLFFLIVLLLSTGCQSSDNAINTAIAKTMAAMPTSTWTPTPTLTPTLTPTITPTPTITLTPTPEYLQFFTEDFESDQGSWSFFVVDGILSTISKNIGINYTATLQDGFLNFEFFTRHTYAYGYYNRFTHEDVRIDAKVKNLGVNENFLTVTCRYDPKVGWYEFNFDSAGLYMLYAVQVTKDNKAAYNLLAEGGANNIKQGRVENEFSLVCQDNTLSAYINGELIKQINNKIYLFSSGYSGVSASSAYRLPIKAAFDWVRFSKP